MRKKISVSHLSLGMYVDELCGSWMDHPFWKTRFLLEDAKDLTALLHSNIRQVWIDVTKGLDLPDSASETETADETMPLSELHLGTPEQPTAPLQPTRFEDELARARKTQKRAKQAIINMFAEARMGHALPLGNLTQLVDEIQQTVSRNSAALLSLVRLKNKDDYTYMHSVAVCALMLALARQLKLPEHLITSIGTAGLLHDVGKMAIDPDILNKPGRLTDEEFDLIKSHPAQGWDMLRASGIQDELVLDVCRHHHEKIDGTGYPDKLSGADLSLYARMGAICDVYDAVTSNRCYKPGWPPTESLQKMASWKGHFDTELFQAFVKTVGIYPTGTMVKLRSNRLAVVVDQSSKSLLLPVVKVFFSVSAQEPIPIERINLSLTGDTVVSVEDPAVWNIEIDHLLEPS